MIPVPPIQADVSPCRGEAARRGSRLIFPVVHLHVLRIARCLAARAGHPRRRSAMRRTLIMAGIFIGISAAHAQTVQPNQAPSQAVVGSDPLNLPTASLPLVSPSLSGNPTG